MELIKEIESRRDKKDWLRRWGLFWCEYCQQEVEKILSKGKRQQSCGCVRTKLSGINRRGLKRTEEQKLKISKTLTGRKQSKETIEKIKQKLKGKKRTEEQRKKYSEAFKGKPKSEKHKQKLREIKLGKIGFLSNAWQNGKSFEIYPQEFNKELKNFILERDKHQCQDPNCDGNHKKLHVHHIDYDKNNNSPENLITLCSSCHTKTNGKNKRQYFTEYYQNIIIGNKLKCTK